MATATIPASNPAGHNQTGPRMVGAPTPVIPSGGRSFAPTNPVVTNPYIPTSGAGTVPTSPSLGTGAPTVANPGELVQSPANVAGTTGALNKQLVDIYGKGIGGAEGALLSSIGGVDSATLQEYIKSLAPEEATAQANLQASLGAGGVGANSSVAALGEANLQAQEIAAIAGESANLTQSGEQLQAGILGGMQNAAEQEVASSGWDVFGQVLQAGAGLAGKAVGAAGETGGFGNLF